LKKHAAAMLAKRMGQRKNKVLWGAIEAQSLSLKTNTKCRKCPDKVKKVSENEGRIIFLRSYNDGFQYSDTNMFNYFDRDNFKEITFY
jgi:hypothetical protein